MAKYTIELGTLIDSGYDIGLKDYPIPSFADENWRTRLNNKIIAHYRFNEICCVPPDKFKHFLNTSMNEVMEKKCYEYEALHSLSSAFITVEEEYDENRTHGESYTDNSNGSTSNHGSSNESSNDYSLSVSSRTPGDMLNVEDDIQNNTYADSANKSKGNSNVNTTNDSNSSSDSQRTGNRDGNDERSYKKMIKGTPFRSQAELYKEYINAVNNIDLEVIMSLGDCFMIIF